METLTPVGFVDDSILKEVMEIAGLGYDKELNQFTFKTNKCKGKCINLNENRKANEDHMNTWELELPIRYYNFCYALAKSDFDIGKALKYAKENLFDLADDPVFLPGKLSETEYDQKKGEERVVTYMSDTKILNWVDMKRREKLNH